MATFYHIGENDYQVIPPYVISVCYLPNDFIYLFFWLHTQFTTLHCDAIACRGVQDKCSKLKSALNEYTSWQTLSPHEALSKVNTVRSSLQQASKTTLSLDTPSKLSNITFEMPSVNMLSSLEHLGRVKVESSISAVTTLPNGSTKHESLVEDDEPPAKRKKEV